MMWPEKRIAFLVIHGVGAHRPFETLDLFARGFLKFLEKQCLQVQLKHELQRHNDWIESFISMSISGKPTIDIYEYYWDCYMTREVTIGEVIAWLDKASDGARCFYKIEMPQLADKYEKRGVSLFKDGEFRRRGYKILLHSLGPVQSLIRFMYFLRLRFAIEPLLQWPLFKDLVIYTTSDVRSQNYEVRRKILDGAVEELKLLLNSNRYDQIIVVGHSLGSVIAYDALNRIRHAMNVSDGISLEAAYKIKGLITLGSPLDKVAFFYKERNSFERTFQRAILAHFHNFKRRELKIDPEIKYIENPFQKELDARWLNFYHLKDPISGHLDAYELSEDDNMECTERVPGVGYHSCYWFLDNLYDRITKYFFN